MLHKKGMYLCSPCGMGFGLRICERDKDISQRAISPKSNTYICSKLNDGQRHIISKSNSLRFNLNAETNISKTTITNCLLSDTQYRHNHHQRAGIRISIWIIIKICCYPFLSALVKLIFERFNQSLTCAKAHSSIPSWHSHPTQTEPNWTELKKALNAADMFLLFERDY